MTVSVSQFRTDFPEFADAAVYPDPAFAFWYAIALKFVSATRWASLQDLGSELYVAHQLVLEARAKAEGDNGVPPGGQVGPLASKSVDKASSSYDTSSGIEVGAGHWNLTIYGTRFIRIAKMVGVGPVQIGGGGGCTSALSSVNAWSGPYCGPGFTTFGS